MKAFQYFLNTLLGFPRKKPVMLRISGKFQGVEEKLLELKRGTPKIEEKNKKKMQNNGKFQKFQGVMVKSLEIKGKSNSKKSISLSLIHI